MISLNFENKSNILNQLKGLNNISVIFAPYQEISLHNSLILQKFKMQIIVNHYFMFLGFKRSNDRNIK